MSTRTSENSSKGGIRGAITFIITVVTIACLMASFVGVGLAVCAVPDTTTRVLSESFSAWQGSPFSKEDLVEAAVETKDYTVDGNDRAAVMAMLYRINANAQAAGTDTARGAPLLPESGATASIDDLYDAFGNASDVYVLDADALSHLDDVYKVISIARAVLIALALAAGIGLSFLGIRCGKRRVATALIGAGVAVLALFAGLALWVIIDFNGFFTAFHSLFFANGTWTFSYDSLLISMYPPEFWIGMGAVWLVATTLTCLVAMLAGFMVKGRHTQRA